MLRENRSGQIRMETPGTLGLSKKLQALTDENTYLERHLAAMVKNNKALQAMRARKPCLYF